MSAFAFDIAQLHFLRPWWLPGLLLVALLAWWWRQSSRRRSAWQDAVDPHLLPHLLDAAGTSPSRAWVRRLGWLAAALAVLALAGPSLRKAEYRLWHSKSPLVIALDLSSASLARDLPPSRLAQARAKIATLLRERAGGQVALVVFAGDAHTVAPLTEDAGNVAVFLDALAPDIMPVDGHRADRAIAWSQRLLRGAGFDHGDILLLSDRADGAAIAEAARARASGYRVSAIGLGTAQGGVFDTPSGVADARLDAAGLQRMAVSGGGAYRRIVPGDADLRAIGVLDPRAGEGAAARGAAAASWRDDGYWLLPLVLLLALPLFRRGGAIAAALAVALLLPVQPAQAQDRGGWWRRPDQQAYQRMQEGVQAYRRKQYQDAIDRFSGNPTADGQYNLGNALARAGRYDEAIAAYDRALKLRPGMDDARSNRAVVEAARKRKPPPGGQRQQQDRDPSQQSRRQEQQGGQGSPRDRPKQGQQQAQSRQPQQAQADAQDPRQQQQADAAQRQRMQDALRRQAGQRQATGKPQQQRETPQQRERRIANQAQLQRVPDDPGALLRTRFRLEHERRQAGGP